MEQKLQAEADRLDREAIIALKRLPKGTPKPKATYVEKFIQSHMFAHSVHRAKAKAWKIGQEHAFLDFLDKSHIGLDSASDWEEGRRIYFDPTLLYFYYEKPKQWELDWLAEREAERKRVTAASVAAGKKKVPPIYWTRLVMVLVAAPGEALSVVRGQERRPLLFICELLLGMSFSLFLISNRVVN
jgi:hypothetical protein